MSQSENIIFYMFVTQEDAIMMTHHRIYLIYIDVGLYSLIRLQILQVHVELFTNSLNFLVEVFDVVYISDHCLFW